MAKFERPLGENFGCGGSLDIIPHLTGVLASCTMFSISVQDRRAPLGQSSPDIRQVL